MLAYALEVVRVFVILIVLVSFMRLTVTRTTSSAFLIKVAIAIALLSAGIALNKRRAAAKLPPNRNAKKARDGGA